MLIVTILWDPSAAHVTLDSLEMEQHVLVNMITLLSMKVLKKSATCFQFSRNLQLMAKKDDILTKMSD